MRPPESLEPLEIDEPAHLRDAAGFGPPLRRYAPPAGLTDLVRRFWVPVWSLPPGATSVQRVLQYPVCQLVIGHDSAVLVGPQRGLSTRELRGAGWAVGAMMQPAAGAALAGRPMTALTDRIEDLSGPAGPAGQPAGDLLDVGLIEAVRATMSPGPEDPARQQAACGLVAAALGVLPPVDEEGRLVNAVVEYVEGDPTVLRVGQICERFALTERTLQRLTARRVGLSPKWLIRRRRLQDAAGRLRAGGPVDLAQIAAELGYTDQAHFTHDFRSVTGTTPGAVAATATTGSR